MKYLDSATNSSAWR